MSHITSIKTITRVKNHILHWLRHIIDVICVIERQPSFSKGDTTLNKALTNLVSPILHRFSREPI